MSDIRIEVIEEVVHVYTDSGLPGAVTEEGPQNLSNKGFALGNNNLTGTKAEFNTALTDGDFLFAGEAQPLDPGLTAIAALAGTTGLLRKAAADTWALDTATYQTAQSVTGIVKSTGTTRSAAVAGTDFVVPGGALGTPSSGNLSSCTADGANPVGTGNIPQNSRSANYTCVSTDANKHIFHPSADVTARTFTIPANTSVAYPVGTTLAFVNQNAAGAITISINTDTMRKHGEGTTGSRTLPANRIAVALKVTATEWLISGAD